MTVFGWDASHYDAPPTARDGIDFYTHKITEGDHSYEDAEYGASMAAARSLSIPILGSYHVQHGGVSVARQASWWVERVTALTPWWQSFPYWTWQIDAEKFDYMTAPTIAEVNALGDEVCRLTGCASSRVLAYAPPWVYGNALTGLRYQLWSSNYGANTTGPYRTIYPGDTSPRWVAPVRPLILQYGSRATIAGQTTCDANAYRGTLDQLKIALGADMPLTTEDRAAIRAEVIAALNTAVPWQSAGVGAWAAQHGWNPISTRSAVEYTWQATAMVSALDLATRLDAILAAALDDGNVTVVLDPATLARLQQIRDDIAALGTGLKAEVRDTVADLGEGGAAQVRGPQG